MKKNCSTLVLDFGGVISKTLFETHDKTEKSLGLKPGTLDWLGPFDIETDPLWSSMQDGKISERDYWMKRVKEIGNLLGENWTDFQELIKRARGDDPIAVIRPEALNAIYQAKKAGKRLAILSNELDLFYGSGFRKKLPFLDDFELIIDATYTKILKPDPRSYAFITDGLSLEPSEIVFVDDQLKNVRGAEKSGMITVHFDVTNPKKSYGLALEMLGL